MKYLILLLLSMSAFPNPQLEQETDSKNQVLEPHSWGIGLGFRNARIPFKTAENKVADVVPLLFFERGDFKIDGLEARFTFLKHDQFKFNALSKYRYFDIPKEYQNKFRGAAFDIGLEAEYKHSADWHSKSQLLFDNSMRSYLTTLTEYEMQYKNINFRPMAFFTLKSKEFNNRYYGLGLDEPGFGIEYGAGFESIIHIWSNFNILANYKISAYDKSTRNSNTIDSAYHSETYLGIAFMDERRHIPKKDRPARKKLKTRPYLRTMFAEATPSNIGTILKFHTAKDQYENKLLSFAYGVPLSDTLLGFDMPVFFQPIYGRHLKSEVQPASNEYILSVKTYLPFEWPFKWRLGAAEGLSYVDKVTYIEKTEMVNKRYRESKLMNFLDFSLDFNVGSIVRSKSLENSWVGAMIHHRSSIFESSSLFGRIKGGSNYIGIYYQHDL